MYLYRGWNLLFLLDQLIGIMKFFYSFLMDVSFILDLFSIGTCHNIILFYLSAKLCSMVIGFIGKKPNWKFRDRNAIQLRSYIFVLDNRNDGHLIAIA